MPIGDFTTLATLSAALGAGLVAGIPIALGVSWSLEGLLYGVAPADPVTIVLIALLTILVSGAASVGPV